MTFVALFAALTAACAVLPPFPPPFVPAPIVVQNIGVMLAGSILGARRGSLSMALFVVLVAVGMPLLTGWRGGFGVILGPTGGFILSWIPAAFVVGGLVGRRWSRLGFRNLFVFNVIGGVGVVYLIGVPWLAAVANRARQGGRGVHRVHPGDLAKAVVASFAALIVKRSYPQTRHTRRGRPAAQRVDQDRRIQQQAGHRQRDCRPSPCRCRRTHAPGSSSHSCPVSSRLPSAASFSSQRRSSSSPRAISSATNALRLLAPARLSSSATSASSNARCIRMGRR